MPKISVVLSVHNGERYLAQAVESILTQTYSDFEFIILNDHSTDSTSTILQTYAARDSRIRLLHNDPQLGLTKSLNRGLQAARGDYIARQDADDLSAPERFAEQVEFLEKNPAVVLVSGNIDQIDAEGNIIGHLNRAASPDLVRWYLLFYNHVSGHSQVMFRRAAALRAGGYDESLPYSQDYDLWLRLLALGEIAILPHTWLQWRTHGDSISTQKFAQQEHLSLTLSQRELSHLLGQTLDVETVIHLRGFWLEPFPPTCEARRIHRVLGEVYMQMFPHKEGNIARQSARNEVKKVVAERFFRWARSVSIRQHPLTKLKLWLYAWSW